MPNFENLPPGEIERHSFAIIEAELEKRGIVVPAGNAAVVKRVIHASADFDYVENLYFSDSAIPAGITALLEGTPIVTDTQMAKAGINKAACGKFDVEVHCHIGDDDVRIAAKRESMTRSRLAVDKAAELHPEAVFVVGNAPTALVRIYELVVAGKLRPKLVVGVPVGFVHVVESKELIMGAGIPCIVAKGRKGGSNIAAAICNALLYESASR